MTTPKPEELKALKACPNPWCAATTTPMLARGAAGWRMKCACGVSAPASNNRAVAWSAWNTRPEPASVPVDVVERVRGLLDKRLEALSHSAKRATHTPAGFEVEMAASIEWSTISLSVADLRALLAVVPLVEGSGPAAE